LIELTFYTTDGCHLCEEAQALLQQLLAQFPDRFNIELVDIVESEQLVEAYGVRIPVVLEHNAREDLGWPFTYNSLIEYLGLIGGE